MMKWEHCFLELYTESSDDFRKPGKLVLVAIFADRTRHFYDAEQGILTGIQDLGEQGWQMCAKYCDEGIIYHSDGSIRVVSNRFTQYWFKRPLESDTVENIRYLEPPQKDNKGKV